MDTFNTPERLIRADRPVYRGSRRRILLRGVVQGVGFRPFVWGLAKRHGLKGWVSNSSSGVIIEVEGASIEEFSNDLLRLAPPRARIEEVTVEETAAVGFTTFEIRPSLEERQGYQLVSPDIATCKDCLQEIFDPRDRRYRYPFTNCTNCGPRFTIIEDMPYDRHRTTMDKFVMCFLCRAEYEDPANRRFHAQPNGCPLCGPGFWLSDRRGRRLALDNPFKAAADLLKTGKIVAIKGLGGFLLAANALDSEVAITLRKRKRRPDKPFAVMMENLVAIREHCLVTPEEEDLLLSPEAPIVLLTWKETSKISRCTAYGQRYLGVMLPYTPLHHLLLAEAKIPLIMTSGNLSEEPIAKDNEEALAKLKDIADFFLLHDRDIFVQYDDSVVASVNGKPTVIRRARGFAPHPIQLAFEVKPTLACGAELKNTFCLARDRHAFVSQHIGDLENVETLSHYERTIEIYKKLFRIEPEIIAYDLHPEYLSTKYALTLPGERVGVQHHFAHIASCLAEHGGVGEVIGVAFDGLGYGLDGHLWGGEFLIVSGKSFHRMAHFEYLPLPGGAAAINHPWRQAVGYIYTLLGRAGLEQGSPFLDPIAADELEIILRQIERRVNTPLTSSCGRLFDVAAALLGLCRSVTYEGQAAVALEMIADPSGEGIYDFDTREEGGKTVILLKPLLYGLLEDIRKGVSPAIISGKFHRTLVEIVLENCVRIRRNGGPDRVALSGGVFQNRLLMSCLQDTLIRAGFRVLVHSSVPCNDGGISLGQAIIANQI